MALSLLCVPLSAEQALFRNASIGFGGGQVFDMQTGDVNNDGRADIVLIQVPNTGSLTLVTMPGNGAGGFGAPITTAISGHASASGTVPSSLALRDLDGDGKLDLILNGYNGSLDTYRGRGDGTFTFATSQPASLQLNCPLLLADLDGDGRLDLIASTTVGFVATLTTFHGNGDGTFGAGTSQSGSEGNGVIGDFDGDGRLDIIQSVFNLQLARGDGHGNFVPPTTISPDGGRPITAGDFNGDGRLDFLSMRDDRDISVYLGDGKGGFTKGTTYEVGELGRGVSVDLDGDGKLDMVGAAVNLVTVMHGNGDGTFTVQAYVGSSAAPIVADFDGDHHLDVLLGLSSMQLLHGNGDGTLVAYKKSFFGLNLATQPDFFLRRRLAVADFNGDGKPDVATQNDGIIVMLNRGDGGFGAPIRLPIPPQIQSVTAFATGDVNGDGRVDIVVTGDFFDPLGQPAIGTRLWTYLGNGDGTFSSTLSITVSRTTKIFLADVDGDGKPDVLLSTLGLRFGEFLLGTGNGTFAQPAALPSSPAFIADFNGDGRPDFTNGGAVFLNAGGGNFTALAFAKDVVGVLAVGDFDGDGKIDLVQQEFSSQVRMRLGRGDGTFNDLALLPTRDLPLEINGGPDGVVADFDGDGKLDLAIGNQILLGNGDGTFRAIVPCVPARMSTAAAAADIDGNGTIDLLLVDSSNFSVDILLTRTTPVGTTPLPLTLTTSFSPVHFQEPVNLLTTATPSSTFLPSGGVTITVDGVVVGFPAWNDKSAVLQWVNAAVGAHEVISSFIGDDVYPATRVSLRPQVQKVDTTVRIEVVPGTLRQLQPAAIFLSAFAPEIQAGRVEPTGTITLRDGDTILSSAPYDPAHIVLNHAFQTVGTHMLTLDYAGDANFEAATTTLSQAVIRDVLVMEFSDDLQRTLTVGQSIQLGAILTSFVDPTGGTVTFFDNGVPVGTTIAGRRFAVIHIQPPWGYHSYSARYDGNPGLDPASVSSRFVYTVNLGPFGTPIEVRATAVSSTNVNVDWSPLSGVTSYDLFRRGPGGSLVIFSGFTLAHVNDTTVVPNTTYLYQVVAHGSGGATSAPSARDWATTVPFTDDPLIPGLTTIKAAHVLELRTAINAMRNAVGLPAATWSRDPAHTFIRAADLTELRAALAAARSALGAPVAFTDSSLIPGVTTVRGIHFQEIRDAVK